MKAIYKGQLWQLGDNLQEADLYSLDEHSTHMRVSFGDPELIVDPTDDQINNILPDYMPMPDSSRKWVLLDERHVQVWIRGKEVKVTVSK